MIIYCNFDLRDIQLSRLLDLAMETFKMYLKIDLNEGVLKKNYFCIFEKRFKLYYFCHTTALL